jgi:Holliday junction resolvase RusA-like endonuclease
MKLTLPMCPIGGNHAYFTKGRIRIRDSRLVDWERDCLKELLQYRKLIQHPIIDFDVWFYFQKPYKKRNDIDSRVKATLDMLGKAEWFDDDSDITDLFLHKRFDLEKPRIEIEL